MDDLLPKNSTELEKNLSETMGLSNITVPIKDVWNPDTCRDDMLPWLAWASSVDEWDASWTEQQKRDAIKASYSVHRHKGTIGAVKAALAALGFSIRVQEWFNQIPAGEPYTFRLLIDVDQVGFDLAGLKKMQKVVESAKNQRSHLSDIATTVISKNNLYTACVANTGNEITVKHVPAILVINELNFVVNSANVLLIINELSFVL